MTTGIGMPKADDVGRWSGPIIIALERLPLPYPLMVALLGLIAAAEQGLEYSLDDPTFGHVTAMAVTRALVFPILVVYVLADLRILKAGAVEALGELRSTVLVSDQEYDDHVRRMVSADRRTELALLAVSVAIVLTLLVVLRTDLLSCRSTLPAFLPAAVFIAAMYVLLGWLLLSLVYASIRLARGLGVLARYPLAINVFDPANLLPFGRLSLAHSLPAVGVVLIPLILFGPPSRAGYLVICVSLVSCLTLFVPLWGVHRQMDAAKQRVLASIYDQLVDIQDALLQGAGVEIEDLAGLADRTATLVHLREMIQESTTWPFRDTTAFARAVVAVTSPLVYFVLNEIIRTYLMPIITSSRSPP